MAIIKWEYGKWDNVMGYQCNQCHTYFLYIEGAIKHEEEINNNCGICPITEEKR